MKGTMKWFWNLKPLNRFFVSSSAVTIVAALVTLAAFGFQLADRNWSGSNASAIGPLATNLDAQIPGLDNHRRVQPSARYNGVHIDGDNSGSANSINLGDGNKNNIIAPGGKVDVHLGTTEPKHEYVTEHEGAGALLMKKPDFRAYLTATTLGEGETLGRCVNGTPVKILEEKSGSAESPPWLKVEILDGKYKGTVAWALQPSVRKPRS